jgi:hypothetical protein
MVLLFKMETCKATIYHTNKSKLPSTRCQNKPKDTNGFCYKHKSQLRFNRNQVQFKVQYLDHEPCDIKMRKDQPIGIIVNFLNQKYNVYNYILSYQGDFIDLSLFASLFDGLILTLEEMGG